MPRKKKISPGDLERLSAYLDRQLNPRQRAELEARLKVEPELAQALRELEDVVAAVGSIEPLRIPRSFTLTPEMVGGRRPLRTFPLLQLATAVSALAFVALVGVDLFGMGGVSGRMAAPANEQQLVESAPAMSDEVQAGADAAFFATGESAADAAQEVTAVPAAPLLGGGAPAETEAEAVEESMKLSSTPVPSLTGEARAALEPETFEQPAPELGAEQLEPLTTLAAPAAPADELRAEGNVSPALEPLRIGEILSGALALLLGLRLILRHRRPA